MNRDHPRRAPGSFAVLALALGVWLALSASGPAWAGNPRLVNSVSGPVTWAGGRAFFNTDAGPLGVLDNASINQMVRDGFVNWQAVPTALISVEDRGPIMLDGAPVDVNGTNFLRVLFQFDGQSPVVYDHDGSISRALGIDGFAGVSFVEFLDSTGQHYTEMAIVLDGTDIDFDGVFTPTGWRGLVAHEEGHHLGLAHSVVNGQAYFLNDPILGLPPPPVTSLETMYPFLHVNHDGQAYPARDDATILSTLYPAPSFAPAAAINGRVFYAGLSELVGANVTIRNLTDPYDDAYASISGALNYYLDLPGSGSGFYRVEGLNAGAAYTVAVSDIVAGGYSSPILSPLPGPDEFYNGANESSNPDIDVPTDFTPVTPSAAPPSTDVILNGAASVRDLPDPSALSPPDDAAVSGFAVPTAIDIDHVRIEFSDTDLDGSQDAFTAVVDLVDPLDAPGGPPRGVEYRVQIDFGEAQRIRRYTLSLKDQTAEPGTYGVSTADVTLEVTFDRDGNPVFSGLPGLAARSFIAGRQIFFHVPVPEILAAATQAQLDAANNFDGTYTVLVYTSSKLHHAVDRVPDTDDNDDPSIVRETSRLTFSPFAVVPTHLASVPDGTLIAVEEGTARSLRIGNTGVRSFSDLALSEDGRLFGSLGYGGVGGIIRIDPATGQGSFLGSTGFQAVPALDFAPPGTRFAGMLFGVGALTNADPDYALIVIDQATGFGSFIGRIGVPYIDSIVFTDDGRLFGVGYVGGGAVLARIDPFTGAGTIIAPISVTAVAGLEVATDGSLLGSLGGVDPQAGGLIRIDPNTGASVFIGATGFRPVSGLTKLP